MGTTRTAWHVLFAILLRQRGPRRVEVRSEVPLSAEPLRADYLLLLAEALANDVPARTLKRLWEHITKDAIVELKSVSRPYRSRNLDRLLAYLHLYFADQAARLKQRSDLVGVLVVPVRSPSLDADVAALGLSWKDLGGGYAELTGGPFALYVIEIDVVAESENDDLLALFGHAPARTPEARRWLSEQVGAKEIDMEIHESEGYDEVIQKLIATLPAEQVLAAFKPEQRMAGLPAEQVLAAFKPEQRVAGLPPEQRMAGLPPEQRLAGLTPEQAVLALPDEVLRGLSDDYLASLPEGIRAAVRARIGH